LNGNLLEEVPSFVKNMKTLEDLYLDHNSISSLRLNGFSGATNLKTLELDGNTLTILRNGVFNGMRKLKTLKLENNFISMIEVGTFDSLAVITVLNLQGNALKSVVSNTFSNIGSLCQLTLSKNAIVQTAKDAFDGLATDCRGGTQFVKGFGWEQGNVLRCPGVDDALVGLKPSECTCQNQSTYDSELSEPSLNCNAKTIACDAACGEDRDRFVTLDDDGIVGAGIATKSHAADTNADGDAPDASTLDMPAAGSKKGAVAAGVTIPLILLTVGMVVYWYYKTYMQSGHVVDIPDEVGYASGGISRNGAAALSTATIQQHQRDGGRSRSMLPDLCGERGQHSTPVGPALRDSTVRVAQGRGGPQPVRAAAAAPSQQRGSALAPLPLVPNSTGPPHNPFGAHDRRISSPVRGGVGGGGGGSDCRRINSMEVSSLPTVQGQLQGGGSGMSPLSQGLLPAIGTTSRSQRMKSDRGAGSEA
jgi:hypothetical protein